MGVILRGTMSRGNVQIVRRLYECWAAAQLDRVPEILHPEIVWTAIESAPDSGTRHGHAEARAYMNDWLQGFDLGEASVEELATTADGGLVCALVGPATEKRSGLATEIRFAGVFRFADDGRIHHIHEYATPEEALEAAGLRA
jgi:ketosteroid isomerase-like protein